MNLLDDQEIQDPIDEQWLLIEDDIKDRANWAIIMSGLLLVFIIYMGLLNGYEVLLYYKSVFESTIWGLVVELIQLILLVLLFRTAFSYYLAAYKGLLDRNYNTIQELRPYHLRGLIYFLCLLLLHVALLCYHLLYCTNMNGIIH